jgi:hypothetical protein
MIRRIAWRAVQSLATSIYVQSWPF